MHSMDKKSSYETHKNVDNIVFLNDYLNIRAGGPCGYMANLKEAYFKYIDKNNVVFISKDNLSKKKQYKLQKFIIKAICIFIPLKKYRKQLRESLFSFLIFRPSAFDYLEIDSTNYKDYIKILDSYNFKTIICHCTRDALFIRNYLKHRKLEAKLMLMSHSPQPPSEEVYHYEKLAQIPNAEKNYIMWQKIEKNAFEQADVLVFPSKEAMEPYLNSLDYFKELINTKEIKFIPTGCAQIDINNSNRNIREEFGIKTKYIISFIGRHTAIKGYDTLKSIADKMLAKRDDITFVIGGGQTSEISPLDHPRWIELGKINPADLLKITDLFILPNRQTYFDLILIETLSSGVPILASNTGGNKTVYQDTQAIELYDNQDDCINKIENFIDTSEGYKNQQRKLAKIAYENNYTLEHFAKNYNNLIINLTKECEQ